MDVICKVLACDYDQKNRHELGPQWCLRLDGAMATWTKGQKVLFVFGAGRLSPEDSRLCDLQKSYVESRGFNAVVPPSDHPNIWGTLGELRYLKSMLPELRAKYPKARIEVFTADYHRGRSQALGQRKVGLHDVNFVAVNSRLHPPSLRARLHEFTGYIEVFFPDRWIAWIKAFRRFVLRKGFVRY